jgi:SAM-dependent methyltransferase
VRVKNQRLLEKAASPAAFEARYRAAADPWNYRYSSYERRKYQLTITSLARARYGNCFEPGCSIGELTAKLAARCDRLFALDVSATAVHRARSRCRELRHVHIECVDLRTASLPGPFDLIVLSEIAYYFAPNILAALAARLGQALAPGGELLAVHWLGESADHVLHADEAHRVLHQALALPQIHAARHPGFRVDSWLKQE